MREIEALASVLEGLARVVEGLARVVEGQLSVIEGLEESSPTLSRVTEGQSFASPSCSSGFGERRGALTPAYPGVSFSSRVSFESRAR